MSDVENSATESAQPVAETGKAASAPKGDKKVIISVVVVVLLLAVGVVAWLAYRPDGFAQSPAKRVGCIDADAIYSLEEFKNAEKQIKDFSDAKTKEFEKAVKEKNGKEGAENELQLLYNKFQNEYEVNRNKIMLPLNTRIGCLLHLKTRHFRHPPAAPWNREIPYHPPTSIRVSCASLRFLAR